MRVKGGEVELPPDHEDDRTNGLEAGVPASLSLGGLEETVKRLEEPIGLSRSGPGDNALEMGTDHAGNRLHRVDLRAHDVGAPLQQQRTDDVNLLAVEDLAELLTVGPGTGGAGRGDMSHEGVQLGALFGVEAVAVLEQHPAHPLEGRVPLLLLATGLIDRGRGMGNDVELVEGDLGVREVLGDALDVRRGHVDAHRAHRLRRSLVRSKILGERSDTRGFRFLADEDHIAPAGVSADGDVLLTPGAGGLVDGQRGHSRVVGRRSREGNIALADRRYAVPTLADEARHRRKGHLLAHGKDHGLEKQSESVELARPGRLNYAYRSISEPHP